MRFLNPIMNKCWIIRKRINSCSRKWPFLKMKGTDYSKLCIIPKAQTKANLILIGTQLNKLQSKVAELIHKWTPLRKWALPIWIRETQIVLRGCNFLQDKVATVHLATQPVNRNWDKVSVLSRIATWNLSKSQLVVILRSQKMS